MPRPHSRTISGAEQWQLPTHRIAALKVEIELVNSSRSGGRIPIRAVGHTRKQELTTRKEVREHFKQPRRPIGRSAGMTRTNRQELERKLEQARRLALEPTDALTRERLAQLVEDLELQLQDQRKVA
jgi:hypothetical protein